MDKSMIKGILLGGAAVTAVAASGVTGYQALNQPRYAEVLAAREVTEKVRTPREECADVAVRRKAPVQDEYRIAGTAIGAVAGGYRAEAGALAFHLDFTDVSDLAAVGAGRESGRREQQ